MPCGIKIRVAGAPGPCIVPPGQISVTCNNDVLHHHPGVRFSVMNQLLQKDDKVWVKILYVDPFPFRMECAMTMVCFSRARRCGWQLENCSSGV